MKLPFRYNRIIRDSLSEVSGWYFSWKKLWSKLWINYETLNSLFNYFDKQDDKELYSEISGKDFNLILDCIETTLKELGEEDMHIHTWIDWDEANKLYRELKLIQKETF